MEFQLSYLKSYKMMLLKCCAQFSSVVLANLENSAVVTEVEKVSFHSILTERQCQRMFKLPHNCTHFTCQQGNAQKPSSQASAVCEPRTSKYTYWVQKRQRKVKMKVAQLCPTLCNPVDSTVHGILQARILEWVAFPFSRGSS